MEIIHPNEIGAKISTVIYNAKSFFYSVSPWINIKSWKKVIINLEKAKSKNIDIRFYVREIDKDFLILQNLNIPIFYIEGLHTKLYLNEEEMVLTSMNFQEVASNHSIDLGIIYTVNDPEYSLLYKYFEDYISPYSNELKNKNVAPISEIDQFLFELKELFPEETINATSTYLYFYKIVPGFDAFIEKVQIIIKSKSKREIANLNDIFLKVTKKLYNYSITNDDPETFKYFKISVPNNTAQKTVEIINRIREISF